MRGSEGDGLRRCDWQRGGGLMASLPASVSRTAYLWLAQRISGGLLAVALPVHLLRLYLAPRPVSYAWVTGMLSNPVWRVFHVALLGLLVFHGMVGLRSAALDLGALRPFRAMVDWAAIILGLGLLAFGLQALLAAPQVR